MSIDSGMSKDVVRTCDWMLFSHKKEWNNDIWSDMVDPEIVVLSEVSQKEKDKYHWYHLICGIKKKMVPVKLNTKQKESYRYGKQAYGLGMGREK